MTRCVATNAAGARCIYRGDHGNDGHLFADDPAADAYRYGCLSEAVSSFLAGRVNRTHLAFVLGDIEAMKP